MLKLSKIMTQVACVKFGIQTFRYGRFFTIKFQYSLSLVIQCYHPNIRHFINALQREQGMVEAKRTMPNIAGDKPTKRQKDRINEEVLKSLILSYF